MSQTKTKKIKELLGQLYCFEPEAVNKYMRRIPYMKEEGQDKLIETLEEGLRQQDEMLRKWTERDPQYTKKLEDFVVETSTKLSKEYERQEKSSAEDILKELD